MLCEPVAYTGLQPELFRHFLSSGEMFSIRHFSIDNDLPELHRQFAKQSTENWDLAGLLEKFKESFEYIAGSHTSQAFTVSIDANDVFEIEIHDANAHYSRPGAQSPIAGDFVIQLFGGIWDAVSSALYAECLKQAALYFHNFPEVKRLILNSTPHLQPIVLRFLFPAGFRLDDRSQGFYVFHRD